MPEPTLPVTVESLAARLGMSTSDHAVRTTLTEALLDAQADVEGYLGRAVIPRTYVEHGRWPVFAGWDLTPLDEPLVSITSAVPETHGDPPEPTGYYTVTYVAGLDCRDADKRPILRYIVAAAMNSPEVVRAWEHHTGGRGPLTSVSAEGQSVSYGPVTLGGGGPAGSAAPGALPTLASLDRWRIAGRRVFVRKGGGHEPWPYGGDFWGAPW